jgi:hypothetical protein
LSNQQPIEGVAVVCFQVLDHRGMFEGDRQKLEMVACDFSMKKYPARFAEIEFSETCLNGNFPAACNADGLSIVGVFDKLFRAATSMGIVP